MCKVAADNNVTWVRVKGFDGENDSESDFFRPETLTTAYEGCFSGVWESRQVPDAEPDKLRNPGIARK